MTQPFRPSLHSQWPGNVSSRVRWEAFWSAPMEVARAEGIWTGPASLYLPILQGEEGRPGQWRDRLTMTQCSGGSPGSTLVPQLLP